MATVAELQAQLEAERRQAEAERRQAEAERAKLQAQLQQQEKQFKAEFQAQLVAAVETELLSNFSKLNAHQNTPLLILELKKAPSNSQTHKMMETHFAQQTVCSQEVTWQAAVLAHKVHSGNEIGSVTLAQETIPLEGVSNRADFVVGWLSNKNWKRGAFNKIDCETALTAQFANVLNDFLFPPGSNGVVLHQSPTYFKNGTVHTCDIMAFKKDTKGLLSCPILVCDAKLDDPSTSSLQTRAYAIDLQQQMFDQQELQSRRPLMVGLTLTAHAMEVEFYFPILGQGSGADEWEYGFVKFGEAAHGGCKHLLVVLYALVHKLIGVPTTLVPLVCLPHTLLETKPAVILLKDDRLKTHVFRKSERVFKIFDEKMKIGTHVLPVQDLKEAIDKLPESLRLKNVEVEQTDHAAIMSYHWEPGTCLYNHTNYDWQCLRGVFDTLVELHRCGFVHGDVRDANIIILADSTTKLIDFDFLGKSGISCYPPGYNCLGELQKIRHPNAQANATMHHSHDLFSLAQLVSELKGPKDLVDALTSGDNQTANTIWDKSQ